MPAPESAYREMVERLEAPPMRALAFRSFENPESTFHGVPDQNRAEALEQEYLEHKDRLEYRTPLMMERDDILYSPVMRSQPEKYHVLFYGSRPLTRSYTTHTLKMQQVTRAICRGIGLNADFAEAIALGAKLGSGPFVHASKDAISVWIDTKFRRWRGDIPPVKGLPGMTPDDGEKSAGPPWADGATFADKQQQVEAERCLPWARVTDPPEPYYSSGKQGYWYLAVNPYALHQSGRFSNETLFGIWRHSLQHDGSEHFDAHLRVPRSAGTQDLTDLTLSSEDRTYECEVARFTDDVTWGIENLSDGHYLAEMARAAGQSADDPFDLVAREHGVTAGMREALNSKKPGRLYTHFISRYVRHARAHLDNLERASGWLPTQERLPSREVVHSLGPEKRNLRTAKPIAMPDDLWRDLGAMMHILNEKVFREPRVKQRRTMLYQMTTSALEILYSSQTDEIQRLLARKRELELWDTDQYDSALDRAANDVARIGITVSLFVEMGDAEVFDFLGLTNR